MTEERGEEEYSVRVEGSGGGKRGGEESGEEARR